jgi:hypothetical protein
MIKSILKFYKRLKVKIYIFTKRSSFAPTYMEEISVYEKTCFKICLKLISNLDSEFMIAPMSNKRYIRNNELGIFVTLDNYRVEVTNHVFNYNVKLSSRDWERLTYIYDTETEKRRVEMEKEVSSNIKNSLDHVLKRLNEITDNKK